MEKFSSVSPHLVLHVSRAIASQSKSVLIARVLAGVSLYILGLVIYRLWFHPLAKYPGPFLARVSNWHHVYHAAKGDRHLNYYKLHQKYGKVVRVAHNGLSFDHHDALKDIYGVNKNIQKSSSYTTMQPEGKEELAGIITARNRVNHSMFRRQAAHAFTDSAIRDFEPQIQKIIDMFIDLLAAQDGAPINMSDCCAWLTYDIMGQLLFGKEFGMLMGKERHMVDVLRGLTYKTLIDMAYPLMWRLGLLNPFFFKGWRDVLRFNAYSLKQTETRLKMESQRRDVMHYLIEGSKAEKDGALAKGSADPMEFVGNARGLMVAATDTTSIQLAANLFYISHNPHVSERLKKEVRGAFTSQDEITAASVVHLPYLKAVVDESLRMSPSVPSGVPREPYTGGANIAGEFIPEGTDVTVPTYAIQHNPEYYPDPFKYYPERWLVEESGEEAVRRATSAFAPFSLGARGCLGKRLAYVEMYMTLAKVMFVFDMTHVKGGNDPRTLHEEFYIDDVFTAISYGPEMRFTKRKI